MVHLTVCSYHVTYAFQNESTLYSCLNVKELLARSRDKTWRLRDYNWTPTVNRLIHKQRLNHLVKLAKWLSCVVTTYLYLPFFCMFLSCHIRVSEWILTLYLPEWQGTPCLKQAQNLKFKWLQLDTNPPQPVSSETNTQPFSQTRQMIELCCEYLSVWCIWLYFLIMSCTRFRVNPHSIVAWMSRNSLLEAGTKSEV